MCPSPWMTYTLLKARFVCVHEFFFLNNSVVIAGWGWGGEEEDIRELKDNVKQNTIKIK